MSQLCAEFNHQNTKLDWAQQCINGIGESQISSVPVLVQEENGGYSVHQDHSWVPLSGTEVKTVNELPDEYITLEDLAEAHSIITTEMERECPNANGEINHSPFLKWETRQSISMIEDRLNEIQKDLDQKGYEVTNPVHVRNFSCDL